MKSRRRFLNFVTFALMLLSGDKISANEKIPEQICCFDGFITMSNQNNEIIFCQKERNNWCPFYLKIGEKPINISNDVSSHLLKLGYDPRTFSCKESCDSKPWECEYFLNYEINAESFDDLGNLLITFTHKDCDKKNSSGQCIYPFRELGVWNKDHGFKVIKCGISYVTGTSYSSNNEYLFISGFNFYVSDSGIEMDPKTAIMSLAKGFW